MKELSVGEQRYKAVMAVLNGLTPYRISFPYALRYAGRKEGAQEGSYESDPLAQARGSARTGAT